MTLFISLVLALVPLLGVLYIAIYGSLTTVDGLFMSLILLTMSGILGITALFELRGKHGAGTLSGLAARGTTGGGLMRSGKVQEVIFFESNVGQPNRSVITLSDRAGSAQTLVVEGDMRNALPVGQKVAITLRKGSIFLIAHLKPLQLSHPNQSFQDYQRNRQK
jgi:hypothetical protein